MLLVQEYLLTHSLEELKAEHGVNYRISAYVPWKFSLNYDQILVRDSDELTWECRGLVLGAGAALDVNKPVGLTHIMARPFKRFFNQGQGCAAEVDFNDASLFEKLDGTLCILYHDVYWHVATRSVPDADVPLDSTGLTFRQLFEKAVIDTYGDNFGRDSVIDAWANEYGLKERFTYLFELTAPENQVVVHYPERKIRLLAIRNNEFGVEFNVESSPLFTCPEVPATPENLLAYIQEQNPATFEGVIVRGNKLGPDGTFPRIKVKHPGYVALSKVAGAARNPRAQMTLVLMGKLREVEPIVPYEVYAKMVRMRTLLVAYCDRLDAVHADVWVEMGPGEGLDAREHRKLFVQLVRKREGHYLPYHMNHYDDLCSNAWNFWQQNKKEGQWTDTTLDFLLEVCS